MLRRVDEKVSETAILAADSVLELILKDAKNIHQFGFPFDHAGDLVTVWRLEPGIVYPRTIFQETGGKPGGRSPCILLRRKDAGLDWVDEFADEAIRQAFLLA